MAKEIIPARPTEPRLAIDPYLDIAEFYFDTIQGEGIEIGAPAAFLRLQNCVLNCKWCDTKEVWRYGNPYSFDELFQLMEESEVIHRFETGQHLVVTGGSPLMQQESLVKFFILFKERYSFQPFIEIENECVVMPLADMLRFVDVWNNSPKLHNSRNGKFLRYKPEIIKEMSILANSWFKFVVYDTHDWEEIQEDFLFPGLINIDQIILMPRGETIEELTKNREYVVNLAIENNVRYCTREHVVLWNTTTGV